MATMIRPKLSVKNPYWIDKHRYYELKHFCLQYPAWKRAYLDHVGPSTSSVTRLSSANGYSNPTADRAIQKAYYSDRIELIERVARETDRELYNYILQAVTQELSYTYLKSRLNIPCGRDMYYDRYRRFFWLLSEARN